jgi:hypothetical protein
VESVIRGKRAFVGDLGMEAFASRSMKKTKTGHSGESSDMIKNEKWIGRMQTT